MASLIFAFVVIQSLDPYFLTNRAAADTHLIYLNPIVHDFYGSKHKYTTVLVSKIKCLIFHKWDTAKPSYCPATLNRHIVYKLLLDNYPETAF